MIPNWRKNIIIFLTGQTFTLFGSSLVQYAIGWYVTLSTKDGGMLTIYTLCGFLPQVLISLFAGVWADRFDRKKLIMFSDGAIAVATGALIVLFALGHRELWLLFVIAGIRSVGAGIQMPAISAYLTDIVPSKHLMRVNGINAGIQGVIMILSPALAGVLYSYVSLDSIFWVDITTAIIGISLMLTLKVEQRRPDAEDLQHFFKDMLGGVRYILKTKWLYQFFGFYLAFCLMIGPAVFLTPLMVARTFGDEAWRLTAHEIAFGAGFIVGGVVVSALSSKIRNNSKMVAWACIAFGGVTILLGMSTSFWFYIGVMVVTGITNPFINTGVMTVFQTRVRPDLMGRVFGLMSIIGSGGMPLSMALFGPLSDRTRVENLLIISGILMILVSAAMFFFKEVMKVGQVLPTDSAPEAEPEEVE